MFIYELIHYNFDRLSFYIWSIGIAVLVKILRC